MCKIKLISQLEACNILQISHFYLGKYLDKGLLRPYNKDIFNKKTFIKDEVITLRKKLLKENKENNDS